MKRLITDSDSLGHPTSADCLHRGGRHSIIGCARHCLLLGTVLVITLLSLFSACKRSEDVVDKSGEFPPGIELAGSYSLQPSYKEQIVRISEQGEVELRTEGMPAQKGLAYKNRFRLVIFLDGDPEPTGIFILGDRQPNRWPGMWKGEVRFFSARAD